MIKDMGASACGGPGCYGARAYALGLAGARLLAPRARSAPTHPWRETEKSRDRDQCEDDAVDGWENT